MRVHRSCVLAVAAGLVLAVGCGKDDTVSPPRTTLAAPTLNSPANNAVLNANPRVATFTWGTVAGAVRYNITIEKSTGAVWVAHAAQRGLTSTTYTMPALDADGYARWRVSATDANAYDGPASEWRNFSFNTTVAMWPRVPLFPRAKRPSAQPAETSENGVTEMPTPVDRARR